MLRRVQGILASYFPSWVPSEFKLSEDDTSCLCESLLVDEGFLQSLGFPAKIKDGTALGAEICFDATNNVAKVELDKLILSTELCNQDQQPVETNPSDIRIEAKIKEFLVNISDEIQIQSENAFLEIDPDKTCSFVLKDLRVCSCKKSLLFPTEVTLKTEKRDSGFVVVCSSNRAELQVSPDQLDTLTTVREYFQTNFEMCVRIDSLNIKYNDETLAELFSVNLHLHKGEYQLRSESVIVNLSSLVLELVDVVVSDSNFSIQNIVSKCQYLSVEKQRGISGDILKGKFASKTAIEAYLAITVKDWAIPILREIYDNNQCVHYVKSKFDNCDGAFPSFALSVELKNGESVKWDGALVFSSDEKVQQFNITHIRASVGQTRIAFDSKIVQVVINGTRGEAECTLMVGDTLIQVSYRELLTLISCGEALWQWMRWCGPARTMCFIINMGKMKVLLGNESIDGTQIIPLFKLNVKPADVELAYASEQFQLSSKIYFSFKSRGFPVGIWDHIIEKFCLSVHGYVLEDKRNFSMWCDDCIKVNWPENLLSKIQCLIEGDKLTQPRVVDIINQSEKMITFFDEKRQELSLLSESSLPLEGEKIFLKRGNNTETSIFFENLTIPLSFGDFSLAAVPCQSGMSLVINPPFLIENRLDVEVCLLRKDSKQKCMAFSSVRPGMRKNVPSKQIVKGMILLATTDALSPPVNTFHILKKQIKPVTSYQLRCRDFHADCVITSFFDTDTGTRIFALASKYQVTNELPVDVEIIVRYGSYADRQTYRPGETKSVLLQGDSSDLIKVSVVFENMASSVVDFSLKQQVRLEKKDVTFERFRLSVWYESTSSEKVSFHVGCPMIVVNHADMSFLISAGGNSTVLQRRNEDPLPCFEFRDCVAMFALSDETHKISIPSSTEASTLNVLSNNVVLLKLTDDQQMYYPLNIHTERFNNYVTFVHLEDFIIIHNLTKFKLNIVLKRNVVLQFEPGVVAPLAMRTGKGTYSAEIEGFARSCELWFDLPMDTVIRFSNDESEIFLRLRSHETSSGQIETVFEEVHITNSPYVIVNETDHMIYAQQREDLMPIAIKPASGSVYGFDSPFARATVMITIEGKSFALSFEKDVQMNNLSFKINEKKIRVAVWSVNDRRLMIISSDDMKFEVASTTAVEFNLKKVRIVLLNKLRPICSCNLKRVDINSQKESLTNNTRFMIHSMKICDVTDGTGNTVIVKGESRLSDTWLQCRLTSLSQWISATVRAQPIDVVLSSKLIRQIVEFFENDGVFWTWFETSSFWMKHAHLSKFLISQVLLSIVITKDEPVPVPLIRRLPLPLSATVSIPLMALRYSNCTFGSIYRLYKQAVKRVIENFMAEVLSETPVDFPLRYPRSLSGAVQLCHRDTAGSFFGDDLSLPVEMNQTIPSAEMWLNESDILVELPGTTFKQDFAILKGEEFRDPGRTPLLHRKKQTQKLHHVFFVRRLKSFNPKARQSLLSVIKAQHKISGMIFACRVVGGEMRYFVLSDEFVDVVDLKQCVMDSVNVASVQRVEHVDSSVCVTYFEKSKVPKKLEFKVSSDKLASQIVNLILSLSSPE